MPTEIMSVAATAANSGDIVVEAGTPLTVSLKDAAGPRVATGARVEIQLKDDNGAYFTVETLNAGKSAVVVVGPGTYRFSRMAGVSCGVFSG